MSYTLRCTLGTAVISLAEMKLFLKIDSTADDALISALIEAATLHAEVYCGRDFRDSSYELLTTDFGEIAVTDFPYRVSPFNFRPLAESTLQVQRATVDTIDKVEYSLNATFVTVDSSIYYSSRRVWRTFLLLNEGMSWPVDADPIEDNVRVTFTMQVPDNIALGIAGIYRHVGRMYEERGDCEPQMAGALSNQTAKASGAEGMYQSLQVPLF